MEMRTLLNWYSHFGGSLLPDLFQPNLLRMADAGLNDQAINTLIGNTLKAIRDLRMNEWAYVEFRLHCVAAKYGIGEYNDALKLLAEADTFCVLQGAPGHDPYRRAIFLWIYAEVLRKARRPNMAFEQLKDTRQIFMDCVTSHSFMPRLDPTSGHAVWYHNCQNQLDIEMTRTLEEVYDWYSVWQKHPFTENLTENIMYYAREVEDAIDASDQNKAKTLMKTMLGVAKGINNQNVFLATKVFLGKCYYQMGDIEMAANSLVDARTLIPPESHTQGCVSWMLGLVQLSDPTKKIDAISNLDKSVKIFSDLQKKTTYDFLRSFYDRKINLMNNVIACVRKDR